MQEVVDPVEHRRRELSRDRSDFIRRLFAVAVSVGFASHIGTFRWLADFSTPSREAGLLFVAMVFVVASWDGYLRSLQNDPLTDFFRFVLDIIIVFEYLFLMILADKPHLFLRVVCGIFITYIVWDYVKLLHYKEKYQVRNWADALWRMPGRLFTPNKNNMGAPITIWWTLYFVSLSFIAETESLIGFLECCLALIYGVTLYRIDKTERLDPRWRLLWIAIPLALSSLPLARINECLFR
jgi:hypothetical protein